MCLCSCSMIVLVFCVLVADCSLVFVLVCVGVCVRVLLCVIRLCTRRSS